VGEPAALLELFEALPNVFLFVKDRRHRFVKVNGAELRLHSLKTEAEMIGRTDFDFHPPALAAQYVEEDRRVMASRQPLLNQLWLVHAVGGMPSWYYCSKFPLIARSGVVIGVAGVMQRCDHTGEAPAGYQRLTPACELVLAHYAQPTALTELARRAHLSASQFQREFRRLFGMTPGDYILRVRLLMARRQLEATTEAVGRIALDCGFYDQSHFTRAFGAAMGLSPLEYRNRFAQTARS
jgi:AraC-like DNA-binding protein